MRNKVNFHWKPQLWLIRLIGVIVPRRLRADWRMEWEAELRYRETLLTEWDRLNWKTKMELLLRSTSAFSDALWLLPKRWEDELIQDLRYGVRMLLKHKAFTTVATLSLALGIGANTAIFSVINALMLRMLPVQNAQELVLFRILGPYLPASSGYNCNYPLYEMFRDQNQSFTGIVTGNIVGRARLLINEPGAIAESVQQQRVSSNFFSVLGVNPVLGRTLLQTDDSPDQPGAVISYDYWQSRFGGDPGVVGRKITIGRTALTIVGVAPPGFFGFEVGAKPELWWPIKAANDPNLKRESSNWIRVIGRLRPGVRVEQAQAELETILQQQINDVASRASDWTPTQLRNHFELHIGLEAGGTGYTRLRQQFREPLLILMMAVGLVLLIACVNLANLLLARASARRKEIAVRLALGAGRFRLLRQLLTESVLLSVIGGAAGVLVARGCLLGLIRYLPQQSRTTFEVPLDARVLAFTLIISLMTGLLFGVVPAWQATRLNLTTAMKEQSGATSSRSRLTLNRSLVVTQVALSLFLLIGAGLFVRTLWNLRTNDAGMNYDHIVQFSVDLGGGYNAQQRSDFYKQLLARLEGLPGVQSSTLLYFSLLGGGSITFDVIVPGYTSGIDENLQCYVMAVGPRFFETMKMPILAGRDFGPQDERPAPPSNESAAQDRGSAPPQSVVINQSMARQFFGNDNPIGKHFSLKEGQQFEIIGVTGDAKYLNLRELPPRTFYPYYFQLPERENVMLQFRVSDETAEYTGPLRQLVRELNPQAQIAVFQTMSDVVNESLVQERVLAQLGSAFGLFALLLGCIGLYGVMSYTVTRRTNEIGIRMALGAQQMDVVGMVLHEVFRLVVPGVAIGLTAALATTRFVSRLLFDLAPNDPLTITLATLLMIGVALLAGYLPARKAAQVDPLAALRHE